MIDLWTNIVFISVRGTDQHARQPCFPSANSLRRYPVETTVAFFARRSLDLFDAYPRRPQVQLGRVLENTISGLAVVLEHDVLASVAFANSQYREP
jgi:hypothetical protein